MQVNRYYGISQHFFDNWVKIFLQSYMIIPSNLLPETDNKSMTSKLWPKQWSQLSKKIWVVVTFERIFETVFGWQKNSYLQSWYSHKVVTYEKQSQWEILLYYSNITGKTVYLINPFKPQYPHKNSPNWSLYISLRNKLREFGRRSKHFLLGDHFINSHNYFSW